MARPVAFGISVDVSGVEGLAERLAALTPERAGALLVDAVNESADSAYEMGRRAILRGINLTDDYVQRKMQVEHATAQKPEATITAFAGRGFITSLSHYGAMQLTEPVNWSNERIQAAGHKFGKWPGWTRRTGSAARGIAVDSKAAGRSVEVVRGSRKRMGPAFSMPGKKDSDGNLLIFSRVPSKGGAVVARTGPSVYQLFRVAIEDIGDQVRDDMEQRVADAAEREFSKELQ